MLSPFRYMKEVIHHVFSNCRKTKCIKSNRRSDSGDRNEKTDNKEPTVWSAGASDIWPNMFHRMLTMRNLTSGRYKISGSSRKTGKLQFSEDKKDQFYILKRLLNSPEIEYVVNACDAGREGELIFKHVYDLSGSKKPVKRLWISSLEDSAILMECSI